MAQYFCRVCDSNNGWVTPSGFATETLASHHGKYGFAYEEWNFNPLLFINNFQHGWLEGFKSGVGRRLVPYGVHDVALYVRRDGQNWVVGKIINCEKIDSLINSVPYPGSFIPHVNAVGGNALFNNNQWFVNPKANLPLNFQYNQVSLANIKFSHSDVTIYQTPISTNIAYTRYGALLVNGNQVRSALWQSLP